MFKFFKPNKTLKLGILLLVIFICVTSILNIVIASDITHVLNCHEDNCTHCEIIHLCQIQIKTIITIVSLIAVILFSTNSENIYKLIKKIYRANTLISCKIQLNN